MSAALLLHPALSRAYPLAAEADLIGSSPRAAAVLIGILAFLVAGIAVLLGVSILTRVLRESGERKQRRFRDRWEPVLYARMAGDDNALPLLARSERPMFLGLWLHMLGYVRDDAAENLTQVARELGLENYVLDLLESRAAWRRVLAIRAVTALRLDKAASRLAAKAAQNRPHSSLAAARALLLIRPEEGLEALERLLGHLDWSPESVVEAFKLGGTDARKVLTRMIGAAPPGKAKRLARLAELLEDTSTLPALRGRLLSNRDEEEIAVILRVFAKLGSAADRVAAKSFLSHPSWLVRVQAAAAMGRIGISEDRTELLPLLHDKHWWVRYRAAQSLLKLLGHAATRELRDAEADRYAREMLDRVMAEKE